MRKPGDTPAEYSVKLTRPLRRGMPGDPIKATTSPLPKSAGRACARPAYAPPEVAAPGLLRSAFRPLGKLAGLTLGTVALCPIFATLYSDLADLSYWAALRSLLWGCALLAVLGFWVVIAVTNQLLKESHGRYLGPAEFMPDGAAVLVRVQAATDSTLGSELQEQGFLDRGLDLSGLPPQVTKTPVLVMRPYERSRDVAQPGSPRG